MHRPSAVALSLAAASWLVAAEPGPRLTPVPFTAVHVEDAFWQPRIEVNRTVTLPHNLKMCVDTGRVANFSRAAGRQQGKFEGAFYNDSDVYKAIEGAAYCLAQHPDSRVEAQVDAIIEEIAAAQRPDGYLNSYYILGEYEKRWTNLNVKHELYCAGHMFEAAVAYAQATGKTRFLDVARRFADHIDGIFGPGKRIGWSGHEEIELALVKLYRQTGEERYAKLAKFFIDVRGTTLQERCKDPTYMQAHKPIREQTDVVGHAVRAMYLYAGVADVAALSGDPDYYRTMDTIWHNVVDKKMYITGGVGARHGAEAFGDDYELPNDSAYCETCAAIGLALWNHRLLNLHADGKFADVLERVIYNGVVSGVSLKGDTFFYVNPLSSKGDAHRQPWFGTACCPTNVVRFIPSIPGYIYATDPQGVWVNLYIANTAKVKTAAGEVGLTMRTDYPWSGQVSLAVSPSAAGEFDVNLRIPQWWPCSPTIRVAGQAFAEAKPVNGYVKIRRTWQPGDIIEMDMPMPVERMQAHPSVVADRGRVALQRGPLVYCLEAVDNHGRVSNLMLPGDSKPIIARQPDLLGGVVVIKAAGLAVAPADWKNSLYQPLPDSKPVELTAVPYCLWDHRDPGEMAVWIPESPTLAATQPAN